MERDNWWSLAAIEDSRPEAPPDTFYLAPHRFVEALSIDQIQYYRLSVPIINSDTLRADNACAFTQHPIMDLTQYLSYIKRIAA